MIFQGEAVGIIIMIVMFSLICLCCVGSIVMCVWVYNDAQKREMDGTLWLIVVLIGGCIGCIIYLIVREPLPSESTPATKVTDEGYVSTTSSKTPSTATTTTGLRYCPFCGDEIPSGAKFCTKCGKAL